MHPITPTTFFLISCTLGLPMLAAQENAEPSKQPVPAVSGEAHNAKKIEEAKARLKKTGETSYELGDIKFDSATREIRIPTLLNMTEGVLEYALVHENGKTHESLLRTKVSPTELNLVLLLTHYEPHIAEAAKYLTEVKDSTKALMTKPMAKEGANKLAVSVHWKDKDGKDHTAPLSAWFQNKKTGKPVSLDHLTYTGSIISEVGFAAEFDGSIIATYFDLVAMVNCPVKENADDEIWYVETTVVPPVDTPVTLVISPVIAK
jgi:hypothetical protein